MDSKDNRKVRRRKKRESFNISVKDLIDGGLICPPMKLEQTYLGQRFQARIEIDGRITFRGVSYNSLSTAAGVARKTVIGTLPRYRFPQTNGWTWWFCKDKNNHRVMLNELRMLFVKNRKQ
jgi:hypothetical protein